MTSLPQWLKDSLRCPSTGLPLEAGTFEGRAVLVARPEGQEALYYEIDNGVPILLPRN